MAQTDVTREQIARDLMKENKGMAFDEALSRADMMIGRGATQVITEERVSSPVVVNEKDPWATTEMASADVEVDPWDVPVEGEDKDPWDVEESVPEVESKTEWAPMPSKVLNPVSTTDWTPDNADYAPNMSSLYQPATSDVEVTPLRKGFGYTGVDKTDPHWKGKDDYGIASQVAREDLVGFFKEPWKGPWKGQERLGEEGVAALPEEKPSEYNKVAQIEDETLRTETELAIDERLYTPFLDKAIEEMEAKPEEYEGRSMVEVAREMAMDDRIADAAELTATIVTLPAGGAAWSLLTKQLAKHIGKGAAQKIASVGLASGIGAVENMLAGIVGNLAGGRDWDEGLDMDALYGAGGGAAGAVLAKPLAASVKFLGNRAADVLEYVGGKTIVGDAGRAIRTPSQSANLVSEAGPEARRIEALTKEEQSNTYHAMGENTARREDTATREFFEAQTRGNKEIDSLVADRDAMIASAVTPSEQQAIVQTYDKLITRAENKMNRELKAVTSRSGADIKEMEAAAKEESKAIYDSLMNQKLFGDITVGDFTQMRDKMSGAKELVDEGGKVGISSVGKQFDEGNATRDFLMGARPFRERAADLILGDSPGKTRTFVADALGLREGDVIASTIKGEKAILDKAGKVLKEDAKIAKVEYPQKSVSDAYDYLQQRVKATQAGDTDKVKKAQAAFDQNINNLNIEGVDPMFRDELIDTSRKLKYHSKVVKDVEGKVDLPSNPVADAIAPIAPLAIDALSGGFGIVSGIKSIGYGVGAWATKKGLGKWTTRTTKGKFEQLNKAFNGTLEYNKELAAMLESNASPINVITYMVATEMVGPEVLEMIGIE